LDALLAKEIREGSLSTLRSFVTKDVQMVDRRLDFANEGEFTMGGV